MLVKYLIPGYVLLIQKLSVMQLCCNICCGRTEMEVAAHFTGKGHHLSDARFVGLEKVWRSWVTYRRVREQRWVGLFDTHRNVGGLNKKTS